MARPRKFDRAAVVAAICQSIAGGGLVRDACKKHKITHSILHLWTSENTPEGLALLELYTRARSNQAHAMAEEAIAIADSRATSPEQVQRNRLRVDTRKWLVSKIAPRLYGEKITQEHSGPDGGPIQIEQQTWQFGDKTVSF